MSGGWKNGVWTNEPLGNALFSPEEIKKIEEQAQEMRDKISHYREALLYLNKQDRRWSSNWNLFSRWDDAKRLWWINIMEAQAAKGFPTATTLQATAIMIRMTR